jgi:four helix bundle protein
MKTGDLKQRVFSFEDLEAWQAARRLVNAIYVLTRLSKVSGDFRLCGQVQAAAVSIMSNIAEGFERTHLQEKIQFYNVARGSAGEVRSLLYVISDNFTDATAEAERLRDEVTRVGKLVTGLLNSTARRRGIAARGIVALLSPISYLLTSISFR